MHFYCTNIQTRQAIRHGLRFICLLISLYHVRPFIMLRILHSLPRTHKLLLLPVATMVTVLGTQKIFSAFDDTASFERDSAIVAAPVGLDLQSDDAAAIGVKHPIAEAVQLATSALDATQHHVPISELKVHEILDIEFLSQAHAGETTDTMSASVMTPTNPVTPVQERATETAKRPRIDSDVLHLAMMLPNGWSFENGEHDDGTSYDDYSADPLMLFDEEHVFLEEEIVAHETYTPEWQTYTIQPGDTFAVLAERNLGMGYSEVLSLLDSLPDQNILTRLRVGRGFEYQLDENNKLLALRVMKNARTGYLIERGEDTFDIATIEKAGEPTQRLYAGTVSGSFGRSAEATGLSAAEVAQLSSVLAKKLDFRRDTRRGDSFQVLVEHDVIDGQQLDPRILAVQYEGARMDLTIVRNSTDNRFYTPEGHSLDPAFSRYPFNGSYRQSSSFNLQRKHPVTGRVSPHYGTDFAMPSGTPVNSPANGRVEKVGNHPLAGRFIVVRHDNGYRTRYLHLSQPLVSRGDRVTMGERIALSGNTGRSTGPHLHYEVIVNSKQVDPMRVELPENQALNGEALAAFKRESEQLLATLESGETGTVVASTRNREERPHDGI